MDTNNLTADEKISKLTKTMVEQNKLINSTLSSNKSIEELTVLSEKLEEFGEDIKNDDRLYKPIKNLLDILDSAHADDVKTEKLNIKKLDKMIETLEAIEEPRAEREKFLALARESRDALMDNAGLSVEIGEAVKKGFGKLTPLINDVFEAPIFDIGGGFISDLFKGHQERIQAEAKAQIDVVKEQREELIREKVQQQKVEAVRPVVENVQRETIDQLPTPENIVEPIREVQDTINPEQTINPELAKQTELQEQMVEVLHPMTKTMTDWVRHQKDQERIDQENFEEQQNMFQQMMNSQKDDELTKTPEGGEGFISKFMSALFGGMGLKAIAAKLFTPLVGGLSTMFGGIFPIMGKMLMGAITKIFIPAAIIATIFGGIVNAVESAMAGNSIGQVIKDFFVGMIDTLTFGLFDTQTISDILDVGINFFKDLGNFIYDSTVGLFIENVNRMIDAMKMLVSKPVELIENVVNDFIAWINPEAMLEHLVKGWDKILSVGYYLGDKLSEAYDMIGKVVDEIVGFFDKIINFDFMSLVPDFVKNLFSSDKPDEQKRPTRGRQKQKEEALKPRAKLESVGETHATRASVAISGEKKVEAMLPYSPDVSESQVAKEEEERISREKTDLSIQESQTNWLARIAGLLTGQSMTGGGSVSTTGGKSEFGRAVSQHSEKIAEIAKRKRRVPRKSTNQMAKAVEDLKDTGDYRLGTITKISETGRAAGNVGTISTGKGDFGGKSYGTHQLASKTGTLQNYLKQSEFGKQFEGLAPGSAEFDAKWTELAKTQADAFGKDQEEFIKKTHFNPFVNKLKDKGFDVSKRGAGVQELLYSTANQFGKNTGIFNRYAEGAGGMEAINNLSDEDLIKGFSQYKKDKVGAYFKSSSDNVQAGVYNRFEREEKALLALTEKQKAEQLAQPVQQETQVAALDKSIVDMQPSNESSLQAASTMETTQSRLDALNNEQQIQDEIKDKQMQETIVNNSGSQVMNNSNTTNQSIVNNKGNSEDDMFFKGFLWTQGNFG